MKAPTRHLSFRPGQLPTSATELRSEVRALLERERLAGTWDPAEHRSWGSNNPELSRALGAAGLIGMTWPREFGGRERSQLERYVVTEELLAAGAPAGFHWIADRQSGPLFLRYGTREQKEFYLPRIARGEIQFCIGMSEPDSGSDLASIRTSATRDGDHWLINGTKIWTSNAHRAHYAIALCRTEERSDNRHAGMSQFVIDLKHTDGISIRPIFNLAGSHDFNEVVFDNARVPADAIVGEPGSGWDQVTSELSYERSGPERFLTNFHVLRGLVDALSRSASDEAQRQVGRLVSHLWTLRQASISVATTLEQGGLPNVESALVKDLGTHFQQELPEVARRLASAEGLHHGALLTVIENAIMVAPAYTIQGGTTEILRGIIARGLRLR